MDDPTMFAAVSTAKPARGYRPIEDYAVIGDCHGGALVARDGDIDWCCLDRFDADPLFCRLLDADKGGFLSTRPRDAFSVARAYLDGTNVLRTEFQTSSGMVAVTDFMPVGRRPGASAHNYVDLAAPGWLVRRIDGIEGGVTIDFDYKPSVCFARQPACLFAADKAIGVENGPALYSDIPLVIDGERATGDVSVRAGSTYFLVVAPLAAVVTRQRIEALYAVTLAFWREWIDYCRYDGPHADMVRRSALVLKLMTYAPTGAPVAALTTSLPEAMGGSRNWDYRYCWIRDASLMLHALSALGYSGEARCFYDFLRRAPGEPAEELQVMYGVEGERELTERSLDHLDGYRGSRPVRVGNGAHNQRQSDLHGYVMDGALVYRALGGRMTRSDRQRFEKLVTFLAHCWAKPDMGLWEMRGKPRHFVHSKAMCWVSVDRAIRLFGKRRQWAELRDRIWREIVEHGCDRDGRFRQAFDRDETDAALLVLPMLGLPAGPLALHRTVAGVEGRLKHGDLVRRYDGDDGVEGGEGAFLICSFWLADAWLAGGQYEKAGALFERLLERANDVGLYAEQIDARTGAFLGNFPQAFTHLGLLGSAVNLELFRKKGGARAIRGSYADRARRSVGATFGWRGMLAAFRAGQKPKFFSSRRSQLTGIYAPKPRKSEK